MVKHSQVVSLSHPISRRIPLWPGDPPVVFEDVASLDKDGYFLRRFSLGEHSATHMNAPNSFYAGGMGIDGYQPEDLVRPAVVIDVHGKTRSNPDYEISPQDIEAWERQHGLIEPGSVVLMYTGWQHLWNDPIAFFGQDAQGSHFPGIGEAAIRFLLEQRQIAGVGIDTHGVDPGQSTAFATNHAVLAGNGIVLECLTHLDRLPDKGATLVIGVLGLEGGSGSPASVMAFIP
ncbi:MULTISPECIES: cyclase family protein [Pseudomonas]|uniref:cyclase family protein n=1 Tax=Pseudomonas TaxID=286 RepID=UPI000C886AEE|nr:MULTISPECIES: cyclase family protein [unclassified Pseudomonas]PMX24875.1 cyclase [Pseudomonas sp. GW460-12]PMX32940.1 cyclase [Pseudomonas sp. MPR-R2A4]PMX40083.1 cyclase [Pseudomonas sp. MPR-R2A7]PMX52492.1 cyclase [Pseudomonas sp. MPR-R2A6]PMX92456.1 cyclase [Pseudomonas sp. MPR-R2A3]